jgi:hypothetical protein
MKLDVKVASPHVSLYKSIYLLIYQIMHNKYVHHVHTQANNLKLSPY